MNFSAALDLGNIVVTLQPTPLSCLSTPVVSKGEPAGVLTLYSSAVEPFTASHSVLAEDVATGLAPLSSPVTVRRDAARTRVSAMQPFALRLVGHRAEAADGRGH